MYKQPIAANSDEILLEKQRFLEAVTFLKKTNINKNNRKKSLYTAEWYLVTGTPQSGKTSLLKNSDIHFYLSRKTESSTQHQEINWWVSQHAIYLDTPAYYLTPDKQPLLASTSHLIKKHAYGHHLEGILLVVSIKDLLETNPENRKQTCAALNSLAKDLSKKFHYTVPVFLIINKCDLLSGFTEFFHAYAKDERQQPWGFALAYSSQAELEPSLSHEFDDLVSCINQQLIWRLHHEPDVHKRTAIKDFPVQLAYIKSGLIDFVSCLTKDWAQSQLAGCYFTSAHQSMIALPAPKTPNALMIKPLASKHKGYFIHDLLTKIIPHKFKKAKVTPLSKISFASCYYIIGLIAVLMTIIFFAASFYTNHQKLTRASQLLENYKLQDPLNPNLNIQTREMNNLTLARETLKPQHAWQTFLSSSKQNKVLIHAIDQLYDQQLNRFLVPQIKQSLENTIINDNIDPALLYAALKSYLMLTNTNQFDSVYLYHTLIALWQQKLATDAIGQLSLTQLQTIFQHHNLSVSTNTQLTAHARQVLTQLPADELALAIIRSDFIDVPILTLDLSKNKQANSLFTLRDSKIGVSGFFTPAVYKKINQGGLTEAVNYATKDNWVLGVINKSSDLDSAQLSSQLREQYIVEYAKAWQAFVENIQIKSFQNLNDLHIALDYLSSASSPLTQLINLLKNNIPQDVINHSETLSALTNTETANNPEQKLKDINSALLNLDIYLKNSQDSAAIFKLSKERFLNNGINDPITQLINLSNHQSAPLQNWLYQISINSWQLMLDETKNYIFQSWKNNLYPQYLAQINNRYPFNPNASNDVSIDSIINFFSPKGLLNSFFDDYLQCFVDTNVHPWRLKSLNGQTLQLRSTTLHSFGHAHFIMRWLFPNNDQHLYLPFTLTATEFSNNFRTLTIKLGSQKNIFENKPNNTPVGFTWPNDHNANSLTVIFDHKNSDPDQLNFSGPWGLWRLLQNNEFIRMDQANHWLITLQNNEDIIKLEMSTKQKFNPFNINKFTDFKLYPEL